MARICFAVSDANATRTEGVVFQLPRAATARVSVFDCTGRPLSDDLRRLERGPHCLPVPAAGLASLEMEFE